MIIVDQSEFAVQLWSQGNLRNSKKACLNVELGFPLKNTHKIIKIKGFLGLIILGMSFSFVLHHLDNNRSSLSENMGVIQIWPTTWDFVNVLVPDVKTIH